MKKILLGILIFIIVAIIAIPFLIPTKTIANKITAAVEEQLHKKTTIQNIHFSVFPRLGIRVSGLTIGEPKQSDFYVSMQSFFLQVQWMPLLKKQIHVSTLQLIKPTVELYAVKNPKETPKTTAKEDSSSNMQFNIQKFEIDQGAFTMFDTKMKPTVHLENFSEKLSFDYSSSGTSTIAGTTIIPVLSFMTPMGELGRNTKIEIQKKLQVDSKNIKIQELKILLGSLPISLEGEIQNYASQEPIVDLKFSGGPSDIENIIGLIPSNMISGDFKNIESKGNLFVDGKLKGKIDLNKAAESIEQSDFHVAMTLKNGSIKMPSLDKPMSNISFALNIEPKVAQIKNFHAELGQSKINHSLTVNNYLGNPSFQFETNSNVNLKDASGLHENLPVKDLKGTLTLNLQASGSMKDTKSILLSGSIQAKDIGLQYPELKYNLDHFNSDLKFEKNNILIQSLSLLINGSDVAGSGKIGNPMALMEEGRQSFTTFAIKISSKNFNADALLGPPSKSDKKESITLPESFFKLDGDVTAVIQKATFNKLNITNVNGNIGLHQGLVTFHPVSLQTFDGTITLNGNANLKNPAKPTFDLDTDAKNISIQKSLTYAESINKILKYADSTKGTASLKAKAKGELEKDLSLNIGTLDSSGSITLNNVNLHGITMKQFTQNFSIEKGKLNIKSMVADTIKKEVTSNVKAKAKGAIQKNLKGNLKKLF